VKTELPLTVPPMDLQKNRERFEKDPEQCTGDLKLPKKNPKGTGKLRDSQKFGSQQPSLFLSVSQDKREENKTRPYKKVPRKSAEVATTSRRKKKTGFSFRAPRTSAEKRTEGRKARGRSFSVGPGEGRYLRLDVFVLKGQKGRQGKRPQAMGQARGGPKKKDKNHYNKDGTRRKGGEPSTQKNDAKGGNVPGMG